MTARRVEKSADTSSWRCEAAHMYIVDVDVDVDVEEVVNGHGICSSKRR